MAPSCRLFSTDLHWVLTRKVELGKETEESFSQGYRPARGQLLIQKWQKAPMGPYFLIEQKP